ncbi:MAG: 50S ribosomal protein L11 methyltransferase [Firmicutes bacterium]|nr:50S ribosomal protein L11 methyltransferase [Bacillota bacterium]
MKYIELKIHASRQGVEMVTEMLMRNGITAISVDDPADLKDILDKKNEYGWDYIDDAVKERPDREPQVKVYLDDTDEGREQLQQLKIEVMKLKSLELEGKFGWDVDFGRLYAESEVVDDEAWKDKWKEYFKPARITDRIVVCPSWEEFEAGPRDLVIDIDPGMAFGTGTHETTRLCMALMQLYLAKAGAAADAKSARVLDVGCGSGILSIGAALLGASEVTGVEIDPDAVAVAKENVEKNGLAGRIEILEGDLTEGLDLEADIIVANLMADLVMRLAGPAADHLAENGVFISSGILLEKRDVVSQAIRDAGFTIERVVIDGEWCAIAARK